MPIWVYYFARLFCCNISVMQIAITINNLSVPSVALLFVVPTIISSYEHVSVCKYNYD